VLSRLYQPPKVVIGASAIGYYGDRKEEELTESSCPGKGFLPDLCREWEKSLDSIEKRGSRVVHTRFGVVLSGKGGMLQKMIPLYRLGLGGAWGSGQQIMSWVGIDDVVGAIYHALTREEISQALNVVSPHPLPQAAFSQALAKKLKRPAFCTVPAALLKLLPGGMGEELFLASARVLPQKLEKTGYQFAMPTLESAFNFLS
jgi:uncharacterized protein (TIGR01777 family)